MMSLFLTIKTAYLSSTFFNIMPLFTAVFAASVLGPRVLLGGGRLLVPFLGALGNLPHLLQESVQLVVGDRQRRGLQGRLLYAAHQKMDPVLLRQVYSMHQCELFYRVIVERLLVRHPFTRVDPLHNFIEWDLAVKDLQ